MIELETNLYEKKSTLAMHCDDLLQINYKRHFQMTSSVLNSFHFKEVQEKTIVSVPSLTSFLTSFSFETDCSPSLPSSFQQQILHSGEHCGKQKKLNS